MSMLYVLIPLAVMSKGTCLKYIYNSLPKMVDKF